MATKRTFKRDRRGRFAAVDTRGSTPATERFDKLAERAAAKEQQKYRRLTAERELRAARFEKQQAVREFNQLRKAGSVESAVWEEFEQRVTNAIARLSVASQELNRVKKGI